MELIKSSEQLINMHQRSYLQPVNFNITLSSSFTKKIVSSSLLHERDHMMATERINRSEGDKKLSDIKQILSKSLFSKDKKKALIQKQKLREFLCGTRLDNLPISPETQQKQTNNLLNFLKIKTIDNYAKKRNKREAKPHESYKQPKICQNALMNDSIGRYSDDRFLHCSDQIQKDQADTSLLLDQKFSNILEMNFAQQGDMSLDIESIFAVKKAKREKAEIEFLQPSTPQDRAVIHQKLLQEENFYLRDQLIVFTDIIESQKGKVQLYKCQIKKLKKKSQKFSNTNSLLQKELLQKEENIYYLSNQNDDYQRQYQLLNQEKSLIQSKFQALLRQYQMILSKLQQFQQEKEKEIQLIIQEKNKEKEMILQQLKEKDKDLLELSELVQVLKARIFNSQQDKTIQKDKPKGKTSLIIDKVIEDDDNSDDSDELQMSNSICLSLADAESLKNIIQEKQQMFQQGIETLKKINAQNENKYVKTIQGLQNKLTHHEKTKHQEIQNIKKHYTTRIEQLKSINYQNDLLINKRIEEEQERKNLLLDQMKHLEQKLEENIKEGDQQLQQLLQNCVNELEKERHVNHLLREEFNEQRKANYLMRQEIEKLKRLFTKELYLIQQIDDRKYIN